MITEIRFLKKEIAGDMTDFANWLDGEHFPQTQWAKSVALSHQNLDKNIFKTRDKMKIILLLIMTAKIYTVKIEKFYVPNPFVYTLF